MTCYQRLSRLERHAYDAYRRWRTFTAVTYGIVLLGGGVLLVLREHSLVLSAVWLLCFTAAFLLYVVCALRRMRQRPLWNCVSCGRAWAMVEVRTVLCQARCVHCHSPVPLSEVPPPRRDGEKTPDRVRSPAEEDARDRSVLSSGLLDLTG